MKQSPEQEFKPATSGQIDRALRLTAELVKDEPVRTYTNQEENRRNWERIASQILLRGNLPTGIDRRLGSSSEESGVIVDQHTVFAALETTSKGRPILQGKVGRISVASLFMLDTPVHTEANYLISTEADWSNPIISVETKSVAATDAPHGSALAERLRQKQEIAASMPAVSYTEAQQLLNMLQVMALTDDVTHYDRY